VKADKKFEQFQDWLSNRESITNARSQRDVVSRLKRADILCPLPSKPDSYYKFELEQIEGFRLLNTSVRSQIRRAVSLYIEFCESL
jgi:hypothetical protein